MKTATITRNYPQHDASNLFDITIDLMVKDIEALSDNGKISTLVTFGSLLTGVNYEDVWQAASECARCRRDEINRRWDIGRGFTNGDRTIPSTPCPTYDRIRKTLRGICG